MEVFSFLNANAGALTVIFTAIVTLSTVAYAALTWQLVRETKALRRVETEPALVVYLNPSDRWINLIDLFIYNHGKGVARNIRWTIDPTPQALSQLGVKIGSMALLDGLSLLAPDQRIKCFFGSAVELLRDPPAKPVTITARYENDAGEVRASSFVLDVNQFQGISHVGKSPDVQAADGIERLARDIGSVISSGRISILTQSKDEYVKEQREFVDEMRQRHQPEANAKAPQAEDAVTPQAPENPISS